jgi:hypothetical protein
MVRNKVAALGGTSILGIVAAVALSATVKADSAEDAYLAQVYATGVNGSPAKMVQTGHEVCKQTSLGATPGVMANALLTGSRNVNGGDAITPDQAAGIVASAIDTLCPSAPVRAVAPAPQQPAPEPQPAAEPVSQPASSSKVDAAIAKAMGMVGTDAFGPKGCVPLVTAAYNAPSTGYWTAIEWRDALDGQHKISMDQNPPRGALVFSESSFDGGAGHVDIALGDGTFVSGGVLASYPGLKGKGHYVQVLPSWNPAGDATYRGWAYPPW